MQETPILTLYSNRGGYLLVVILASLLLIQDIIFLFGGSKTLPVQEILEIMAIIGIGGIVLYSLYYIVTPIPLLRLDSTGLSYQRFPLVVRRIRWEDIENISAIRDGKARRGKPKQQPYLMIKISTKLEAVSAYKGRREFSYTLQFTDLFVRRIRRKG